ncbi:MAG: hypothetical protein O7G85_12600 [Planctomycetota bacterium]|nr:hypothetical protein [Planctomycetota bacterium]
MSHQHDPDPNFLDSLEWELNSALRRQKSLDVMTGITPGQNGRLLLAAMLLMAFSLVFGAAGAYAILQSPEQPLQVQVMDLERQRLRLELAEVRQDEIHHAMQQLRLRADTVSPEVIFEAERRVALVEEMHSLQALRFEETSITNHRPLDDITAPLIGNRDFVTERLSIRQASLQDSIDTLSHRSGLIADQVKGDEADEIMQIQAQERVRLAMTEMAGLDRQVEVRASFLNGRLTAMKAERKSLLEKARTERQLVSDQLETARAIQDHLRPQGPRTRRPSDVDDHSQVELSLLELRQQAADRAIDRLEKSSED